MRSAVVAAAVLVVLLCPCEGQTSPTQTSNETTTGSAPKKPGDKIDSSDKAKAEGLELKLWLMAGAGGVAIGIVLTVACITLIICGKCSGDPLHADAGRPRGMSGFNRLPFVPKKIFGPKQPGAGGPAASKTASAASVKSRQASTASLGKTPSAAEPGGPQQGRKTSSPLRRQSSAVDQLSMSTSQIEPSEMSMSESAISTSDVSAAQTSTVVSDAPTVSEVSEVSRI